MSRRKSKCIFCDANDKNWDSKIIPVDMGEFGDYEVEVWVSKYGRNIGIDFGEKHREPIFTSYIQINYCPFCGAKFSEQEGE